MDHRSFTRWHHCPRWVQQIGECAFAAYEGDPEEEGEAEATPTASSALARMAELAGVAAGSRSRTEVSVGAPVEASGELVALPVEAEVGRVTVPVAALPSAVAEPVPTVDSLAGPLSEAMIAAVVASLLGHFYTRGSGMAGFGGMTVNWRAIIDEIAGVDAVRSRRLSEAEDLSARLVGAGRVPGFDPRDGSRVSALVSGVEALEGLRRRADGSTGYGVPMSGGVVT